MKFSLPFLIASTCAVLTVTAVRPVHAQTETPDPALLAKAKISYEDAKTIALKAVPDATVKSSELENEDGGLRWSFDLATAGSKKITEVGVDALTGKIVENKVEKEKSEAGKEADDENGHHHKKRD